MRANDVKVRLTLRIPRPLDEQLAVQAKKMGIPKNTYISLKLHEAMSNEATASKTESA